MEMKLQIEYSQHTWKHVFLAKEKERQTHDLQDRMFGLPSLLVFQSSSFKSPLSIILTVFLFLHQILLQTRNNIFFQSTKSYPLLLSLLNDYNDNDKKRLLFSLIGFGILTPLISWSLHPLLRVNRPGMSIYSFESTDQEWSFVLLEGHSHNKHNLWTEETRSYILPPTKTRDQKRIQEQQTWISQWKMNQELLERKRGTF